MKKTVLFILLMIGLLSCGSNEPHQMSDNEKAVLDTLRQELKCDVSYGTKKELTRFSKPYDFILIVSNSSIENNQMEKAATLIARKYYPHLNNKERYQNLVVRFESTSGGAVGTKSAASYNFSLDK